MGFIGSVILTLHSLISQTEAMQHVDWTELEEALSKPLSRKGELASRSTGGDSLATRIYGKIRTGQRTQ